MHVYWYSLCIRRHVQTFVYACMYACMHACMHQRMYVWIDYTRMYACNVSMYCLYVCMHGRVGTWVLGQACAWHTVIDKEEDDATWQEQHEPPPAKHMTHSPVPKYSGYAPCRFETIWPRSWSRSRSRSRPRPRSRSRSRWFYHRPTTEMRRPTGKPTSSTRTLCGAQLMMHGGTWIRRWMQASRWQHVWVCLTCIYPPKPYVYITPQKASKRSKFRGNLCLSVRRVTVIAMASMPSMRSMRLDLFSVIRGQCWR